MSKESIAFVGVGRMGANMARRLKDCGYEISAVNDVNKEAAAALAAELGAKHCESLADLTASADVIFTVVTNDAAMRGIFLSGGDTLLDGAAGKVFVNCATLSPGIQKEVADAAAAAGAKAIEGCMASSISHAREGKLFLMIGGEEATFEQVKPILEQMSVNLKYIGAIGKAAQVKALVNMVMNINTAGLVLETDSDDMIARDHEAWFTAEHAAKDSGIAKALADEAGLVLPLNDAAKAQYDKLTAEGKGQLDKSGIAELTFKDRHR